jgi:hypothetical protein
MTYHKTGLHIHGGGIPIDWVRGAPVLCCTECSVADILDYRQAAPDAWIVVRWHYERDEQADMLADPVAGARAWFNQHIMTIEALKGERMV